MAERWLELTRGENDANGPIPIQPGVMRVAFTREGVEHVFRLAKTNIGSTHFKGRSYKGLLRHMILCQLVMLFVAEQTTRLRGEKSAGHDGADRAGPEHGAPRLAAGPLQMVAD